MQRSLLRRWRRAAQRLTLLIPDGTVPAKRISIKDTRGIIDAILDGSIASAPTKQLPYFNFEIPTELPGVDPKILDPRDTYAEVSEWEAKAKDLSQRFIKEL